MFDIPIPSIPHVSAPGLPFFSELSDKQQIFKPKRDPSKKIHIHRAGQRPAGINDEDKVEAPPSKPKRGDGRAALERARAKAREGTAARSLYAMVMSWCKSFAIMAYELVIFATQQVQLSYRLISMGLVRAPLFMGCFLHRRRASVSARGASP